MIDLRAHLIGGGVATMLHTVFNAPNLVEYLGTLGFHSVLIDCEHGSAGIERVEEMVRAARLGSILPIVRPERLERAIITRYLDCQAQGVMVPHVDTEADARYLAKTVHYARPDRHVLTIAMIESQAAICNLDRILDVDGIDVFFVARHDLSKDLGIFDGKNSAEVRAMVDAAIGRIRSRGRIAGAGAEEANAASVVAAGAQLVLVTLRDILNTGAAAWLDRSGLRP